MPETSLYRYARGAVHLFPVDDPGVALCGVSAAGSEAADTLTCEKCREGRTAIRLAWLKENLSAADWALVQSGARDSRAKLTEGEAL